MTLFMSTEESLDLWHGSGFRVGDGGGNNRDPKNMFTFTRTRPPPNPNPKPHGLANSTYRSLRLYGAAHLEFYPP